MHHISKIKTKIEIDDYLLKRKLIKQYLKCVKYLLNGNFAKLDFKLRKPESNGIYSFRVNKQYRAFGYFKEEGIFIVFEINNHSDF